MDSDDTSSVGTALKTLDEKKSVFSSIGPLLYAKLKSTIIMSTIFCNVMPVV